MTTIAYDGEVVACDSMTVKDDYYSGNVQKMKLIGNEIILSISGSLKIFEVILPYIKNIYLKNHKKENFVKTSEYFKNTDENWFELTVFYIKIIDSTGLKQICRDIYVNSLIPNTEIKCNFYVSGSGGSIALGAMMAGASAIKAVDIASKVDLYTGGNIVSYNVKENLKTVVKPNYKHIIHKG